MLTLPKIKEGEQGSVDYKIILTPENAPDMFKQQHPEKAYAMRENIKNSIKLIYQAYSRNYNIFIHVAGAGSPVSFDLKGKQRPRLTQMLLDDCEDWGVPKCNILANDSVVQFADFWKKQGATSFSNNWFDASMYEDMVDYMRSFKKPYKVISFLDTYGVKEENKMRELTVRYLRPAHYFPLYIVRGYAIEDIAKDIKRLPADYRALDLGVNCDSFSIPDWPCIQNFGTMRLFRLVRWTGESEELKLRSGGREYSLKSIHGIVRRVASQ